eukprot:NODE_185_length_13590_cov_0.472908.p1 type:complete len:824 gc:universal NODE_185_length_13590_cov_0.472908:5985-8456(+)
MENKLQLDGFYFDHLRKPSLIENQTCYLSNVIIYEENRNFVVSTLSNKIIATIPVVQYQKTAYLHNYLFGISKNSIHYFKEEWIKYHTGEILDYFIGDGIYLLLSNDLLYLDVNSLPPLSQKLQFPILNHIEKFVSHPTSVCALIYSEGLMYVCNKEQYLSLTFEGITDILFHPDGSKVAIIQGVVASLFDGAKILSGKLDLIQKVTLSEYRKLCWVGHFLADLQLNLTKDAKLRIFGSEKFIDISLPGIVSFFSTVDGLKFISKKEYHFLFPQPLVYSNCVLDESTHPAKSLINSFAQWEQRKPNLDFKLLPLENCIKDILDASSYSFDILEQKRFLKIARFAIAFQQANQISTEATCRMVRVLNNIRYSYDPFFTVDQYNFHSITSILEGIVSANMHFLAFNIAKYLKLNSYTIEKILIDWCQYYLLKTKFDKIPDKAVSDKILKTCASLNTNFKSMSFSSMAQAAIQHGRPTTAIELLMYESVSSDQIPLFLKLKEDDLALRKAMESCNRDLVVLVLQNLINRQVPFNVIYMMLKEKPFALNVFKSMNLPDRWIECCFQEDLKRDHIHALIRKSKSMKVEIKVNSSSRQVDPSSLDNPKNSLTQAYNICTDAKWTMDAKLLESQIKLLEAQQQLENDIWTNSQDNSAKFLGLTLSQTIEKCVTSGLQIKAQKLKSDFRVQDKKYWWIYIKAAASIRDWASLEKFSEKKSPIGYEPFAKVCIEAGAYKEACLKYIPKCPIQMQTQYYIKIKAYNKAAQAAYLQKNGQALKLILQRLQQEDSSRYFYDSDDVNDYTKNQMRTLWIQETERKMAELGILVINK